MLDRKFVVENAARIKANCAQRGVKCEIDRFLILEQARRAHLEEVELANQSLNRASKQMASEKDPALREILKAEGKRHREQAAQAQTDLKRVTEEANCILLTIPNLTHPSAPVGGEQDSKEVRIGKTPIRKFDFKALDHVALGEKLGIVDFEAGARTTGHGFYFLKNEAVLLDLALERYALDVLMQEGFTLTTTPDLARNDILVGIGFNPRGPETQVYSIENSDLSLVGTAEITLGGMYFNEMIDADKLPIKVCGISHCFRTEAGAHGAATRGLYRVHQFTKVEMFAYTLPDQSDAMHEQLLGIECKLFDGLGIPYRVIDTASGDLGGPAYRKFDLEAWMPGRGAAGEYGEVTSASNCTDYQSRRLNIRFRTKGEKGTQFVHTLNGTAVAISRALIAVIENYQEADGSITVPEALRKWVGKDRIGP
ncbi:MAG: serine--tRNA ligase [Clostridia bacterium]|nr:serine--tRNA ligase [Deltaproteobacteria bacterium]